MLFTVSTNNAIQVLANAQNLAAFSPGMVVTGSVVQPGKIAASVALFLIYAGCFVLFRWQRADGSRWCCQWPRAEAERGTLSKGPSTHPSHAVIVVANIAPAPTALAAPRRGSQPKNVF